MHVQKPKMPVQSALDNVIDQSWLTAAGSVNAAHNNWRHRWLVYFDKQKTAGGIFIYDSTEVGPLPILLFGGTAQGAGSPLLRFDSTGKDWDTALLEKEEEKAQRASSSSSSSVPAGETSGKSVKRRTFADPTVQFVAELVAAQPGAAFGMSRLSGLLKRSFPQHRERIGKIRHWLSDNDDVFCLSKMNNAWTITLVPEASARKPSPHDDVAAAAGPSFFGVQDWVYFRCDAATASLVERCKIALDDVLRSHVASTKSGQKFGRGHSPAGQVEAAANGREESEFLAAVSELLGEHSSLPAEHRDRSPHLNDGDYHRRQQQQSSHGHGRRYGGRRFDGRR